MTKFNNKLYLFATVFVVTFGCLNIKALSQIDFQRIAIDVNSPVSPWGKSVGDIDGDGLWDLLVGGHSEGGLVWYRNPGSSGSKWVKSIVAEGSGFSTDIEVVDIDLDGYADIIVLKDNSISWFKKDKTSNNEGWVETLIENQVLHDIEAKDFDKDGDIDIIGRNQSEWAKDGNVLHFYEQLSPSDWVHTSRSCPHGEGLLATDIDGDGKEDILSGANWYKNNGNMTGYHWTEQIISKSWNYDNVFIATGDINGDGLQDVVLTPSEAASNNYHISWFEHPVDAMEEWEEHIVEYSVECILHFVGCADFDMDGNIDIVTAEMEQGADPDEVKIHRNVGNGTSWVKTVLWAGGSHSCRVFDSDNDGDLDFFGANHNGSKVYLWVNRAIHPTPLSLDKWYYMHIDTTRNHKYMGLALGDLNDDGKTDIASGNWVYFCPKGDMSGNWQRKTLPINVDLLLKLNVDDDEHPDLIAEDGNGDMYWLEMNDINGNDWYYRKIGNVGTGNHHLSSQGYILGDVEKGDKSEIVIVGGEQPNGAIYYFKIPLNPIIDEWPRITVASSVYPEGVACSDLDGDGDIDLCSTSEDNNTVSWYENPGNGEDNWNRHYVGLLYGADRFVSADIDGDGRVDIISTGANKNENGIYWFKAPKNPKTGQWIKNEVINTGSENTMNSLDMGDMDIDGDIDIISGTHRGELKVSVWENDGSGNFTEHIVDSGKESHLGARITDMDGDGDLDIVSIAWDKFQYLHLWRNDAIKSDN